KVGRVVLGVTEKYLNSVGKTTLTAEDFVGADTISPFAFSGNSVLQSVTVPSDIYRIYDRAFIDCKKLTEAEISASTNVGFTEIIDGAEVVSNSVFDGCVRLAKLTIGLDVKIEELFGNEPETGFTLFKGGYLPDALKELVLLPDEISTVKKGAYNGLTTVEKIVISDGITAIEDGAFVDCAVKEIVIADSVVSIGYNGEDYTESRTSSTEYVGTFGSTLQKVVFTENSTLRAIFDNAFRHTLLADIALPASLEYIGKYAFADNGREYINALTFGDSGSSLIIDSYAFENVKFNPSDGYAVRFPSGLREIAEGAFKNCAGLFGVTIGNNLSSLGEEAFAYSGLKSFDIPESVAYTDGEGEVIFKNLLSGTSVTELTLRKPVKVAELFATVPASLAKITVYGDVGQEAFFGMSGLKNAIIEDAINIGSYAFYDCEGLARIELPATVKSIGDFAFAECANLTTFIIKTGSELKSIGEYVFKNDEKLLSAFLPATVENDVFTGVFYGCKSLTATSALPSTVKTIGDETFYGCKKLTSVSIPEEAERIGAEAFFGCVSMEIDNVRFDSLVSIGARAFYNCTMITGIKAQNILSTGAEAFYGCASLEEISVADASIAAITDSPLTVLTVNISSAINVLPTGVFDGATAIQNVMVYSESDYINDLLEGIALAISEDCKVFVTKNGYLKISDEIKNGVLSGKIFVNPTDIDATFVYDEEKRTAKIASVGNYSGEVIFFPAYTYKEGISGDIEEYAVTSIGERVLADSTSVKEIIIPYTVESIDGRAFKDSDISSVRFETGSRLATIGEEAFRECAFLKEIKLPNGVKEIKRAAFYESGLTSLRVNSFGNLAVIESYAFYNCSGLKSMTIEASSLSDIQAYAFAGSGLESVAINENCKLKSVGEYAFANCNGLTRETVVFPVGAVVADNAFANY
ncbi:MAG: leucine-rich repeat protein, partial [Christensenellales bacterium]